jgi:oligopeptide/dipeptide ABC transporter ATP-binding protein
MTAEPLLKVAGLSVRFDVDGQAAEVVRGIDFSLERGRTLCLVGESGCGKSVSAMALLGLLPRHARLAGSARFDGRELIGAPESDLRKIRGGRVGMIFQEPMTSLNPTMTVGEQIAEVLRIHLGMGRRQARARAIELMGMVRIARAGERVDDYPFTFSGGMRQRVMIALALACSPALLIADEPTTALDVTVQAEILDLLRDLQRQTGTALLMITHDLGVVAEIADEVAVMYAGGIVERGSAERLFEMPEHPYTIGLLGALPSAGRRGRLTPIEGRVPPPTDPMPGCRFSPRCPFSVARCVLEEPDLMPLEASEAACWQAPLEVVA